MDQLRLPSVLENCHRILVAGAGGGFDVFAGLPVYERPRALGKLSTRQEDSSMERLPAL